MSSPPGLKPTPADVVIRPAVVTQKKKENALDQLDTTLASLASSLGGSSSNWGTGAGSKVSRKNKGPRIFKYSSLPFIWSYNYSDPKKKKRKDLWLKRGHLIKNICKTYTELNLWSMINCVVSR